MSESTSKERLLQYDDSDGQDYGGFYLRPSRKHPRILSKWVFVLILLLASVTLNIYFVSRQCLLSSNSKSVKEQLTNQQSPYSGLPHDVTVKYTHHTAYTSNNKTYADEMWDKLSIDPLIIAASPEWIEEKGLPPSWDFPWDPNKKIYFVKVFHQLHCLKALRKAIHELSSEGETVVAGEHLEHCLDSLRQDLMCKADDTPMPSLRSANGAGDDQEMQCIDFSKLVDWTRAPERNSCYRHITNYVNLTHPIERYAFCEEGSEYYPVMKEYFEINGHHDPFLL